MIRHAIELDAAGKTVHLMTQDTDVLVLGLRRLPILDPKPLLMDIYLVFVTRLMAATYILKM